MSEERNPWTTLASRVCWENGWLSVVDNDVRDRHGNPSRYGVIRFKKRGVAVLPIDPQGQVVLIGQFRYGLGRYRWELPKGGHEPDEDPLAAARRELAEEAGLAARRWLPLLRIDSIASLTDSTANGYVAWGLEPAQAEADPQEELAIRRVPFAQAVDQALGGGITDSSSIALLLALDALARRGRLPADLAACLDGAA